jgi:Asp-tRNA(Asn)/Glu-tRNA(Gln) amidotransferase C subunit
MSDELEDVRQMARRAGIDLGDSRAENVVRALPTIAQLAQVLASIDYGEAEPSSRFRAPKLDE